MSSVLEDPSIFLVCCQLLLVFYISPNLVWCLSRVVSSLIVNGVSLANSGYTHFYCVLDCLMLVCNHKANNSVVFLNHKKDSRKQEKYIGKT